jgi:hypothetical protein
VFETIGTVRMILPQRATEHPKRSREESIPQAFGFLPENEPVESAAILFEDPEDSEMVPELAAELPRLQIAANRHEEAELENHLAPLAGENTRPIVLRAMPAHPMASPIRVGACVWPASYSELELRANIGIVTELWSNTGLLPLEPTASEPGFRVWSAQAGEVTWVNGHREIRTPTSGLDPLSGRASRRRLGQPELDLFWSVVELPIVDSKSGASVSAGDAAEPYRATRIDPMTPAISLQTSLLDARSIHRYCTATSRDANG